MFSEPKVQDMDEATAEELATLGAVRDAQHALEADLYRARRAESEHDALGRAYADAPEPSDDTTEALATVRPGKRA